MEKTIFFEPVFSFIRFSCPSENAVAADIVHNIEYAAGIHQSRDCSGVSGLSPEPVGNGRRICDRSGIARFQARRKRVDAFFRYRSGRDGFRCLYIRDRRAEKILCSGRCNRWAIQHGFLERNLVENIPVLSVCPDPQIKVPEIVSEIKVKGDSVTLPALIDSIGARQVVEEVKEALGDVPSDTIPKSPEASETSENSEKADTSMIPEGATSAIKMKRDTTQMDSIELAIYKHNKVIDDSLARDSINKKRKNGIDAPVEYSADDSLTYDATSATAHLYGNSKVKYTNMDLASERIYMSLDSNLVHATGKLDSTTNKMTGTPVFKMGSDEYQQQEMSFNFKTKKGFITDVYTQQEDGFLTSEMSKRGEDGEMFL